MTRRNSRQKVPENPVSDLLLAGVREISLFVKPVIVEQAFIDGIGVMDV